MSEVFLIREDCPFCDATGLKKTAILQTCSTCCGRGWVSPSRAINQEIVCNDCNGAGSYESNNCQSCQGRGYEIRIKKIGIEIEEVFCPVCVEGIEIFESICTSCGGIGLGISDDGRNFKCGDCEGTGYVDKVLECRDCHGSGLIETNVIDITPSHAIIPYVCEEKKENKTTISTKETENYSFRNNNEELDKKDRYINELKEKLRFLEEEITNISNKDNISVPIGGKLDFEIFPGKIWNIDDIIVQCEKRVRSLGQSEFTGKEIDINRMLSIKKLKPKECYIGDRGWSGYVVFSFDYTQNVILECPFEGNATYVIHTSGDWRKYINQSRLFLRENYPENYTKCVHKGDWLDRVKNALNSKSPLKTARSRLSVSSVNDVLNASSSQLIDLIIETLATRPNSACPEHSIVKHFLLHVGINTRGVPREKIERMIFRQINTLVGKKRIKRYKISKNVRLKLI